MRPVAWCSLSLVLVAIYSCQGDEFVGALSESSGDAASAGDVAAVASGGQGGAALGSGGTVSVPAAGEPGVVSAGAGGEPTLGFVCEAVGKRFAGHCYVPVSGASLSAPAAADKCAQASAELGLQTYLLSLETAGEEKWFVAQFLEPSKATHDAWLALACNDTTYPNLSDCACKDCSPDTLALKRSHWAWLFGARTEGWKTVNPNGDGRCAALSWDAVNGTAWVDRVCGDSSYSFETDMLTRDYLTVCEIEL